MYFHTMLLLSHIISTIKIFFLFMCLHFFSTAKTGVLQGTRPPRTEEGRELYRNAALPMHTAPICTNNTASTRFQTSLSSDHRLAQWSAASDRITTSSDKSRGETKFRLSYQLLSADHLTPTTQTQTRDPELPVRSGTNS